MSDKQSSSIELGYQHASHVESQAQMTQLQLAADTHGPALDYAATLKDPISFRDGLISLFAVVSSDFRYAPKDRAAYQAYVALKKANSTQNIWKAQQAYFEWLRQNDPMAYWILDPVVTVQPQQIIFEVFSKDEAAYAKFSYSADLLRIEGQPGYGTTNIDYSERLIQGFGQIRSWHPNRIVINQQQLELKADQDSVVEKTIEVPDSWIRGFLQVQTIASHDMDQFKLAPVDLYNILRQLRLHADIKGKRRGIRIELEPDKYPRLVLEPWEKVIETTAVPYTGKRARVVRVWGRRRLSMLQGFLPYAEDISVHLMGNGLPSFWVLSNQVMSFTLGMTGFTSSNWSQALNMDLLIAHVEESPDLKPVLDYFRQQYNADLQSAAQALNMETARLYQQLQAACQLGQIGFDIHTQQYFWRPLTHMTLELDQINYRNASHRHACDLVDGQNAVSINSENHIYNTGVELVFDIEDKAEEREYQTQMLINEEGGVNKAKCSCPHFRKHRLQQGPCAHLIAARIFYSRELEARAKQPDRHVVLTETRTMSRRNARNQEQIYIMVLDKRNLQIRWGYSGEQMRLQQLRYNTPPAARAAFDEKLNTLAQQGYLDISAG